MSENGSEQSIDVTLPDGQPGTPQPSRAEKRAAIAKARAIRREAAAKEREAKKQAAAEARALVAQAKAASRKKEKRNTAHTPPLTNTGVIHWLESLRRTEGEADKAKRSGVHTDTETLVAELAAARKAVQSGAELSGEEITKIADIPGAPDAEHRSAAKEIVEKIAAEVAAEQAAAAEPSPNQSVEAAGAIVEEIAAQVEAGAAPPASEAPSAEAPQAEPMPEIAVGKGQVVDAILARLAEENPPEPEPAEPQRSYAETIAQAQPKKDPLQPAFDAEVRYFAEKRSAAQHAADMESAAEQYRKDTADAKAFTRRLQRKTDRAWKKEASAIQAKDESPRIRRKAALVNVTLGLTLLFGAAAGMLLLERPTVSESENRALAKKPDFSVDGYLDGSYTNGMAEYYNDTVPFRELFKGITGTLRQYMGMRGDNGVIHEVGKQDDGAPEEPEVTTAVTEDPLSYLTQTHMTEAEHTDAQQADEPIDDGDGGEVSNSVLVVNKRGIMLYGGSYTIGERYASYLNQYQKQLGSGVQVWSMVIPTPCSFYTPEQFQNLIGSEKNNIAHIDDFLEGAKPVDVYSTLEKHADEPVYMRTDHHWSALGAFYAAEAFAKTARVPFARITEYDKVVKEGYVGTLYGYSGGDITLKNNPEDFFYYVPHAGYETTYYNTSLKNARKGRLLINLDNVAPVSWYLVYMGTDETVTHVQTEVKNGRRLAIIKDSYGNALVPWLTSSFEEITVIDMRYFKKNAIAYLKEIGVTDVLFAMNTFSATGGNAKHIETIRKQ
jgi:hypothetical protein